MECGSCGCSTIDLFLVPDTKPKLKNHYRAHRLSFWLNLVPDLHRQGGDDVPRSHHELPDDDDVPQQPQVPPLRGPTVHQIPRYRPQSPHDTEQDRTTQPPYAANGKRLLQPSTKNQLIFLTLYISNLIKFNCPITTKHFSTVL